MVAGRGVARRRPAADNATSPSGSTGRGRLSRPAEPGAEHAHPAGLTTFAEFDHLERRRVVVQFVREVRVARGRGRYVKTPIEERVEIIWRDAPDADLVRRAATAERARIAALSATA